MHFTPYMSIDFYKVKKHCLITITPIFFFLFKPTGRLTISKMASISRGYWVTLYNKTCYNPPALLLPTVLVNIIVVVVYFYPCLRIRYPEFILVVIIVVSEARYKKLHSASHCKVSEWVGVVDTASSYEPKGRGFESRLVSYFFSSPFFRAIVWILLKSSRKSRDIKYILYMQLRKAHCVELNWQPIL